MNVPAGIVALIAIGASSAACAINCGDEDNGRIVNICNQTVTFAFCGLDPRDGMLDCRSGRFGMAGVMPSGTVISSRGYSRVFYMHCNDGGVPANVRWTGSRLVGDCR